MKNIYVRQGTREVWIGKAIVADLMQDLSRTHTVTVFDLAKDSVLFVGMRKRKGAA
jgi:hypothetical protein